MKNNKFALPENMTSKARNGFNITVVLLIILILFDVYSTYNFLTLKTSTQLFAMSLSYVMSVMAFAGAWLSWKNRVETAGWLLIVSSVAALFFSNFLGTGLGIIYGVTSVVVVFAIASATFPQERIGRAVLFSFIGGIAGVMVDIYFPNKAAAGAVPPTFTYVMLLILMALLIFVVSRQYGNYSLRTKLLVGGITLILISVGTLGFVNDYNSRSNLTASSGTAIKSVADAQAAAIGNVLLQETHVLQSFALSKVVQDRVDVVNAAYGPDQTFNQQQIDTLDKQWRAADTADNNNDPLVSAVLNSDVASELREFRDAFPENVEVFVTDKYGANVAATNRTSDYYQADEDWWQAAYNGGQGAIYIGQPEFDQSSKTFGLNLAVPLYGHGTSEVTGVLRTTLKIDSILSILNIKVLSGTGNLSLYLPEGQVLAPETSEGIRPADTQALTFLPALLGNKAYDTFILDGTPSVVSASAVTSDDPDEKPAVQKLGWTLVVNQSQADNLAPIRQQTRSIVLVALIILAIGTLLTALLAQLLSGPIVRLTAVAEQISAGNTTAQAKVETGDEIGTLASTFNNMTSQLQNTLQGLEQRVADRTQNLELAAKVARSVSQVRALDVMLKDACDLILKEFNLYYVQVYLTNPSQTNLVLEAGTGEVGVQLLGRGHNLPLNTGSINGRAAIEKNSVVIADTTKSATFRQNLLLPETRGEMAVPLIVADKVVGVLDMQSSEPGTLNEEVLPAFEALAGQLAVAIQNANLVAETEQARAEVEKQARRLVRTGWGEHMDGIHKPEQLGYVFDNQKVSPLADVDESQLPDSGNAISASISVTGESLGSLVVEMSDNAQREQTSDLVNIVARQVAQQIENLRLLENAERYRSEAEKTARLQTVEGWQNYINSRTTDNLGYIYDLKEVRPYSNEQDEPNAMTLPVKARDEKVGKLSIQGLTSDNIEELELANVIAERLGAHIESLRLSEETRQGQVELDKRARQLAAVAEISTASSQELEVDKLLSTVVHLTQRQFGLYHAHIFTFNEGSQELQISACGWQEGDEHEGTHETVSIPLDKEQSLVARAARTGRAVIVNDVKSEAGWLANPLLPDTASEMAVPLVVGDRVLGVLDVQSNQINAFTQEDANIQTTLASQVATAMQNARSFTQAQRQAERESMLNVINQKIQSATSVEAVLQIAARELGTALGAPMTVAQLSMKDKSS